MTLLTCDIGSTHFKLQFFTYDRNTSLAIPSSKPVSIHHGQDWILSRTPLDSISEHLNHMLEWIISEHSCQPCAIGLSTFREAIVGLSSTGQIVFAGTNLQQKPVGHLDDASVVTTFAGWLSWKMTGHCRITDDQRTAGDEYIASVRQSIPRWCAHVRSGAKIRSDEASDPAEFLGGTEEHLGYLGAGLLESDGPPLVISTGTFWSVSSIAVGLPKQGTRRTGNSAAFPSVDSCILYKWGKMIQMMSEGSLVSAGNEPKTEGFFGNAASLWFSHDVSIDVTRQAAINDLKASCSTLSIDGAANIVVYGGGSRMAYARDLIREALPEASITFMDTDATLLGCAITGGRNLNAN